MHVHVINELIHLRLHIIYMKYKNEKDTFKQNIPGYYSSLPYFIDYVYSLQTNTR